MSLYFRSFFLLCISFLPFLSEEGLGASLKVGVTAGPHGDILNALKPRAQAEGLDLEIIEFNDFILPNSALSEKEIDANSYQHTPFLENQMQTRGYNLTSVGKTILLPLGVYSTKINSLKCLNEEDTIALPNDPTNEGRALLLLQKEGLLKLKEGVSCPSLLDILENPKNLKFVEVEAPQLPRALEDVTAALINTDWILVAGMDPQKNQIAREDTNSPYANVLVVRTEDKDRPDICHLVRLYQSEETRRFIEEKFKGAVIPAWSDTCSALTSS